MMEHRLTVQGTNEVYVRTKQQMEIAEKLRKEQRTLQIDPQGESGMNILLVQYWNFLLSLGRPKVKNLQPAERVSPVPAAIRKPNRPKPPPPSFSKSAANRPGFLQNKPQYPQVTSDSKRSKSSSRNTHSLKDRVIHMLALKPHSREHIVTKLKKGEILAQ